MTGRTADMWAQVDVELRKALSCPVEQLVAAERRTLPIDAGRQWEIPDRDRTALRESGLPPLSLFTATPQTGSFPLLMRHPADERESCLLEGRLLYRLGFWGADEDSGVAGVTAGVGRVLYLLPAPITTDDLPEVLRPYNPGLYKPALSVLSSSVAQFVETCWRWHAALKVIEQAEEPLATAPESEWTTHYDNLYACVDRILDAVHRIDAVAATDDPESVWTKLIRENSV